MKQYFLSILLILSIAYACRKCPTQDELQGTWTEQGNSAPSKLTFNGDTCFFLHTSILDTFSYTLDKKHADLRLTHINHPEQGTNTYGLAWHKKKAILTVIGLFPAPSGEVTETNYKK